MIIKNKQFNMKTLRILVISLLCLITTSSFAQSYVINDTVPVSSNSGTVTIGNVIYDYNISGNDAIVKGLSGGKTVSTDAPVLDEIFILCPITLKYNNNVYEVHVSTIYDRAFAGCNRLKKVFVQSGLSEFQDWAFNGSSITELWLPEGINFGQKVFNNCNSLMSVYFQATTPATAGKMNSYSGISNSALISLPCTSYDTFLEYFLKEGSGGNGNEGRYTDAATAEDYLKTTPLAKFYVTDGAVFADGLSDLTRGNANVTEAYCQIPADATDPNNTRFYDEIVLTATELSADWKFAYWIDNRTGNKFAGNTQDNPKRHEIRIYYTIDGDGNPVYESQDSVNHITNNVYTAYFVEAPRIIDTKTGSVAGYTNEDFVSADNGKHYGSIDIYCYGNTVPEITAESGVQVQTRAVNVIREFDASRVFYFSLPFDCDYNHITVTKNGVDCKS